MKQSLWKYGFQKGHTQDWDLQIPWLVMRYNFIWHAFLSFFSPYILFGHEPKLPTSIWRNVMVIINLDDLNVWWIHACEQWATLFQHVYPWLWKILQLPKIGIHFVMPLLTKVVMSLKGVPMVWCKQKGQLMQWIEIKFQKQTFSIVHHHNSKQIHHIAKYGTPIYSIDWIWHIPCLYLPQNNYTFPVK